jgi:hypothetical protein
MDFLLVIERNMDFVIPFAVILQGRMIIRSYKSTGRYSYLVDIVTFSASLYNQQSNRHCGDNKPNGDLYDRRF